MDYAMSVAWGPDSRGFWTQRKRSMVSLLTVFSMIAGVAAAFKMFENTVPNNVVRDASTFQYEVWKQDTEFGDTSYYNTAGCTSTTLPGCTTTYGQKPIFDAGLSQYPGDTRNVDVKVINTNTPQRDATFYVYIDNITVTGCVDGSGRPLSCENLTPTNLPFGTVGYNAFLNFWTFLSDKQNVLQAGGPEVNEDDHGALNGVSAINTNPDKNNVRQYTKACEGGLKTFVKNSPCDLGRIRKKGTTDTLNGRTDQRYYVFRLRELDDQTDQSAFKGWTINFSLVFQARVPAVAEVSTIGRR